MRVLVTGANGFIGKNLIVHLNEQNVGVVSFTRDMTLGNLAAALKEVDFVFHLAGVNRPKDAAEFAEGNTGLTETALRVDTHQWSLGSGVVYLIDPGRG